MKYHRQLMQAILYDKIQIAKAVNVNVIRQDDAPQGYKDFDKGAAKKFVLDPHGMIEAWRGHWILNMEQGMLNYELSMNEE